MKKSEDIDRSRCLRKYSRLRAVFFLWSGLVWACQSMWGLDAGRAVTQFILDNWQITDGLPANTVQSVTQTSDGYIWIGTQEGLVRFNGVYFKVYNRHNTPQIKSDWITTLYSDKEGGLWIGTLKGGLVRRRAGRFSCLSTREGLPSHSIHALYQDRQSRLWIGTEAGLACFQNGRLSSCTGAAGLSGLTVWTLCGDRRGSLWCGTNSGLWRLQGEGKSNFSEVKSFSNLTITSIYEDRQGVLWVGSRGGGLFRRDNGTFSPITIRDGLSNNMVRCIAADRHENLWVGTDGNGLNRLNRRGMSSSQRSFLNGIIRCIYEDLEGSLWIGTEGSGLCRLKEGKLTVFSAVEGLSSGMVMAVLEDRAGALWVGTDKGLNRLKEGRWTHFMDRDGLSYNDVTSMCEDSEGSLWVGTFSGLNRFHRGAFTQYSRQNGLSSDMIRSLYRDPRGNLWIGTNGGGLNLLKNGKFYHYTTRQGLSHDRVGYIHEDRRGNLWIGTDRGLNSFREGRFEVPEHGELGAAWILCIHEDLQGRLWIGTNGSGLFRLTAGSVTQFSTLSRLLPDRIAHILEDNRGDLWLSSSRGIFQVSKQELNDVADGKLETPRLVYYTEVDGMASRECNGGTQPAGWKSRDGRLWFPTIKGLVMIDPGSFKVNQYPPPVVIEAVTADKMEFDPALVGQTETLNLPAGTERLGFHFAGLSYVIPQRVSFRYKLEGYDRDWRHHSSPNRIAYYMNIPPGSYTFRVIAANNDGIWNRRGAAFTFYLKPFFYQTPWFYALYPLVLIALFVLGHRLRVRHLKKRAAHLQAIVNERTRELNVQNKKLEQAAITDPLTGLYNRRKMWELLHSESLRYERNAKPFSLILGDIDHFKTFNDQYGHDCGDFILVRIAALLRSAVREQDAVSRWGGEEFLLLLPETGRYGGGVLTEKIRRQIDDSTFEYKGIRLAVTMTFGLAVYQENMNAELCLKQADEALLKGKQQGRNCWVAFD